MHEYVQIKQLEAIIVSQQEEMAMRKQKMQEIVNSVSSIETSIRTEAAETGQSPYGVYMRHACTYSLSACMCLCVCVCVCVYVSECVFIYIRKYT